MKNKILFLLFSFFLNGSILFADNLKISAKNIILDKNKNTSVFENQVSVVTKEGDNIESDFAEYNKDLGKLILKKNIILTDRYNNILKTNYAEYDEIEKIFFTKGSTELVTTEKYIINSSDLRINKRNSLISSNNQTIVTDEENNNITLENFRYNAESNIFKSIGNIKIKDRNTNAYEFSQIYIDTKKREIVGTDIKAYLNQDNFKIKKDNKPRVFANSLNFKKGIKKFGKNVFTLCDYREGDKCPPWSIQSTKMLHDSQKKTIYYDNAVIKIYDLPIFYFPKLAHPDPTVDRRSGFLPPTYSDSKNLGSSISVPYFFDISRDKNFTLTNKFYVTENPLFMGEYHQAFKNSYLLTDFSFTEGYKKNSIKKSSGSKSHFFSYFVKDFEKKGISKSSLGLSIEKTSNDKYLKLYKIKSNLTDYEKDTLESNLNFTHENENLYLGLNASIYENLKNDYNDKYEYILPELVIDKNLLSNKKIGSIDLQTNLKVRNYDTNKLENFLVNDLNWSYRDINFKSGVKSKILGNVKNVNYETKNVELFKDETTNELFGALGYLSEVGFQKVEKDTKKLLKPKLLLRYSPNNNMRKDNSDSILNPDQAFSLNRLNNINNFETGFSATLGIDYESSKKDKKLDFSIAQIINNQENKKMPTKSSLDEKLSDAVFSSTYKINKRLSLKYDGAIDQNYNELNYNDLGAEINLNPLKINFNYLEENKHIGDQKYFKSKFSFGETNSLYSFETKRNLITNSAEFYNLSYEYINDCLRAGLVYRREFYKDSEIEPENSLMFKITLTPFGNINSPSFSQ